MPLINFSGIASGIDSEALIDAMSDVTRQTRIQPHEEKITQKEDATAALQEMKSKLSTLKSQVDEFSTLSGGGVLKQAISSDETVMVASASNAASEGSYQVTVTQKAKNATYSVGRTLSPYTSADQAVNSAIVSSGSPNDEFSVAVGTGGDLVTVTTTVTATMTLTELVTDLNTQFESNGGVATASVVNVGTTASPDYRIFITSANEGTAKGSISVTIGSDVEDDGSPPGGPTDAEASTSQATNATFTLDGVSGTITRNSNTINDLIPGITFNILSTGTSTVSVGTDISGTIANLQEYVDSFNDIVQFVNENNLVVREEEGEDVQNVFGSLARTTVDDSVLTSLRSEMSGAKLTGTSSVKIFADLGITTQRDGTLKFDESIATSALEDSPASVRGILENFGDSAGLTGGTIDQYIRFNGLIDITINSNDNQVQNLNARIARAEAFISSKESSLRARFARLEGLIGQLQSQQSNLQSILAGL